MMPDFTADTMAIVFRLEAGASAMQRSRLKAELRTAAVRQVYHFHGFIMGMLLDAKSFSLRVTNVR